MVTIKIPAVKSTKVIVQEVNEVIFSDGIKINVTGPNNTTARKPLYLAAYALANAPVVIPPIKEPPVVIPPTNPEPKTELINPSDLYNISKAKDVKFIFPAGTKLKDQYPLNPGPNVIIDFSGVSFETQNMETFKIEQPFNNLTLRNINLNGLNRNLIAHKYKGTTASKGLSIENVTTLNSWGLLYSDGEQTSSGDYGLIHDISIKNLNSKGTPSTIFKAIGDNTYFEKIVVDQFGIGTNEHGMAFMIYGQMTSKDFTFTHSKGSFLRLTPFNFITMGKKSIIDNGLAYDQSRYSFFDIHQVDGFAVDKFSKNGVFLNKCDVDVLNCTALQLGTDRSFRYSAKLADAFETYSIQTYKNCVGADLFDTEGKTNSIIHSVSVTPGKTTVIESGNEYRNTIAESVNSDFSSKFTGKGFKPF